MTDVSGNKNESVLESDGDDSEIGLAFDESLFLQFCLDLPIDQGAFFVERKN